MIPIFLKVENFLSYKKADIDFNKLEAIIGIIGTNGKFCAV